VSAPFAPPPVVDLLVEAIEYVRPHLNSALPIGERLRNLWAAVVASRDRAAWDVIEAEFLMLARETGLVRALGRHADEDLRHVIRWAMWDQNPF
jgi:hypothetical protein